LTSAASAAAAAADAVNPKDAAIPRRSRIADTAGAAGAGCTITAGAAVRARDRCRCHHRNQRERARDRQRCDACVHQRAASEQRLDDGRTPPWRPNAANFR